MRKCTDGKLKLQKGKILIMRRIILLFLIFSLTLGLCSCNSGDLSDIVSSLYDLLPQEEEIVEVKYEYFTIENPRFSNCYKSLNSKQKEFYSRIYAISEEMTEGFVDVGKSYSNAVNDFSVAYNAFLYDNAEIFWMPNSYVLANAGSGAERKLAVAFSTTADGRNKKYNVTKAQRDKYAAQLDKAVNKVLGAIKGMSEYEKELYINDYICDNVTYKEKGGLVSTAYGALVQKKALCEGYSRAFKLLCNKAGIECELIIGESDGVGHMWNRVNIDLKHSYVDVTWNDRAHKTYAYFNITDEQLEKTHSFAPVLSSLTSEQIEKDEPYNFTKKTCSFTGNSYYEKKSLILWQESSQKAADEIDKALKKGDKQVEFMFATKEALQLFESDPNVFISKIQNEVKTAFINSYALERDVLILFFEKM